MLYFLNYCSSHATCCCIDGGSGALTTPLTYTLSFLTVLLVSLLAFSFSYRFLPLLSSPNGTCLTVGGLGLTLCT